MRLTDIQIKKLLKKHPDLISPEPKEKNISGVTCDIHLSNEFRTFNNYKVGAINLAVDSDTLEKTLTDAMTDTIHIKENGEFFLHPGEFALGCVFEEVNVPDDIVMWLDGRSSLARLGLQIHVSAHRIDPGFSGQIVLEFFNAGKLPLALQPKMKIGALSFEQLSSNCEKPYRTRIESKYRNQTGATASKINPESLDK